MVHVSKAIYEQKKKKSRTVEMRGKGLAYYKAGKEPKGTSKL